MRKIKESTARWETAKIKEDEEIKAYLRKIAFVIVSIILFIAFIFANEYVKPLFEPTFLKNVSSDTNNSYIEYIEKYNNETNTILDAWITPLAYIYTFDNNVDFDEGEQYLLNQFINEGLVKPIYSYEDYEKYFNNNQNVLEEYLKLSAINKEDIDMEEVNYNVYKLWKNKNSFMSLIEKKINDI